MILNNEAERCRQAYQKYFEETLKSTNSLELAVDSCAHLFLDGKPVKKGYTNQVRSSALWQCHFWRTLPDAFYSSDVVAFALGRSLHNGLEDATLFKDLLHKAPETLKRGVRYSQIFLKPDSSPWKKILSLPNNGNKDFLDFLKVCHRLHAELCASDKAVAGLQRQLDNLTIFEYLLYASLFTFQNLVPERFHLSMIDDEWVELHQSAWDALSELLMWKLKTRDEKDLKLNERFLAKSLKCHLIPLLLPGEGSPAISLKNLEVFSKLVTAVIKRNNFLHRTIFDFCLDDDYRYKFDGEHLTLYPIEIPEESEWDFNGRKFSALHSYWFNRAVIEYFNSDLSKQRFGLPENDVSNRLAYIKATQVYLQLDEIYGMDPVISLPDGTEVNLFKAIHSLELMTAFFNVSYIGRFQELQQDSGHWLSSLSQLMIEGLKTGENRFPLTWAEPGEKAQRIKSWMISDSDPDGDIRMAEAILDFWTNDLQKISDMLKKAPNSPTPELHENPIIKLGKYGFQLPWLMASQNNSTAAINNLRRIGCRRKGRKDETDRIESRLGDLFRSKGFAVVHSYQPDLVDGKDPGEVDLLCYMDNHLLVLEVKSTYIRKTKQDAWIHRTSTLRKASQQLSRKTNAIAQSIENDANLQLKLKLPDQKEAIKIHPWIVDTSIEYDQELIDGYLKVSLEGLIVILNNERELLTGNLLIEEELPEDDMFSEGFSIQRFIEIVEKGELWSVLE